MLTSSSQEEIAGIITMEDVIEELIGEEIVDETDLYVDVHKRIAVARARVQLYHQRRSLPEEGERGEGRGRRELRRAVSDPEPSISPPVEELEVQQHLLSSVPYYGFSNYVNKQHLVHIHVH